MRFRSRRVVPFALLLIAAAPATAAPSLALERTFVTDGTVLATASDGSQLFLGGMFTYIGQRSGELALATAATGVRDKSVPELGGGIVNAIVPDGSGGYFIGGDMRSAGSLRLRGLAHLTASGTWDPAFKPSISGGVVQAVAVDATRVYVGGTFKTVNGTARASFAAFDRTTGALTSLDLHLNGSVFALASTGSALFLGGGFTTIGGQSRSFIARLDTPSDSVATWNAHADNAVDALLVAGQTVYAGGAFANIGGAARSFVAGLDTTTALATALDARPDAAVFALALAGNSLYLGGGFATVGGVARARVAAVNASTGAVLPFKADADRFVRGLLATSSALYVAGDFATLSGAARRFVGAVDPATGAPLAFDPHASHSAQTFAVHPRGILIGGSFTSINGQDRRNLAAIDLASRTATSWKPLTDTGASSQVDALLVVGSTVYIAGAFTTVAGQPRANMAAVSTSGALLPFRADTDRIVRALATRGSTLYLGGELTQVNGIARSGVAAVDVTTGNVQTWTAFVDPQVYALAVVGSWVWIGGDMGAFTGSELQWALVMVDATSGAFGPNLGFVRQDIVLSLATDGTTIWAGGAFAFSRTGAAVFIDAFVGATGAASSWTPSVIPNGPPYSVAVSGQSVYYADNQAPNGSTTFIHVWDKTSGALQSFAPKTDAPFRSLLVMPGGLAAGGGFRAIDGVAQSGVGVFSGSP